MQENTETLVYEKKKNQEEITRFKATINAGIIVFFMNGVIGPPTKLLYEFIISFWWCANQQQQRHQQQNDYATNFQPISISNKMQWEWESVVFGASIKYSLIFIICIDHCSFLVAASLSQHHHLLKICSKRHGKKRDRCKPKRFVNTIKVCVYKNLLLQTQHKIKRKERTIVEMPTWIARTIPVHNSQWCGFPDVTITTTTTTMITTTKCDNLHRLFSNW